MKPHLQNIYDKEILKQKLKEESFKRITLSFYRYVKIENPQTLRDQLYLEWNKLGILGRIYLAEEGINAQMNVPEPQWDAFVEQLYAHPEFTDMPFKIAVEDGESFIKLTIKVRKQIVADGLTIDDYDISNVGNHLNPEEFNKAMEDPDTIVVDMRNHYESRIGHFKNAILPDVDTFKEQLPVVKEMLEDKKDKKVLLYCTGGIRCEKASAYLKHHGFKDVNQLHGGIIAYAHDVKQKEIKNNFRGKNFVFDERLAEPISDEVIANCDQCDAPSDRQLNCHNQTCHLLFIQCEDCAEKMQNTCSMACKEFINLPLEEQKRLRKGNSHPTSRARYTNQIRPKFKKEVA